MREIKFKARHTKTGLWWYGSSAVGYHGYKHYRVYALAEFWGYVRNGILDAKTVGQYTGRKDKNGKELYAGEIIEYPETSFPLEIIWDDFVCGFMLRNADGLLLRMPSEKAMASYCISIGNIYENPELLGGVDANRK